MALSQIQCLDDNNVNFRTNQSKPEFFYSEDQRLALEKLLDDGQERFEEFVKTNSIRPFLSELELAELNRSAELYSPGSPDSSVNYNGDSDTAELSLQYWPERSDRSLPDLDIGWPTSTSYRGVTRVSVYAQPPLEGQTHIKEIVRKMIVQAQKVIAIVMDLFTDLDIFKDLLDASFKRKVAVYIMLETTAVPHFLEMCEKAAMHTGHLKNLRVRSIRGIEFFTRTSKKVCGSQSQRFMFVDGDKAVSGSYSFTWTASRLDRNIITVLSGQVVDAFDNLFQDLYVMSNAVNLHNIKLDAEPKPEPPPQTAPVLPPSATMALKLINPKYALVSSSATANSNRTPSEKDTAKIDSSKQMKERPDVPQIHPGLLHLEKINMTHYLPLWPLPDPPSDVIGFINIKHYNKPPQQSHLMPSEITEVSQAIRLKHPFHVPETVSERASVITTLELPSTVVVPVNEQHNQSIPLENIAHDKLHEQMQLTPSNHRKESEFLSPNTKDRKSQNNVKDKIESPEAHDMEKHIHSSAELGEEIQPLSQSFGDKTASSSNGEQLKDNQISVNPPLCPETSFSNVQCKASSPVPKVTHTSFAHSENTSVSQNCNSKTAVQDNQRQKLIKNDMNDTDSTCLHHGKTPKQDSSCSSASEEYFECSDSVTVDSVCEGLVKGNHSRSRTSENNRGLGGANNTDTCGTTSVTLKLQQWAHVPIMAGVLEQELRHESLKETDEARAQSGPQEQSAYRKLTGTMMIHQIPPELEGAEASKTDGLSDPVCKADKQQIPEIDASTQLESESKPLGNLLKAKTDTQVESEDNGKCRALPLYKLAPEPCSVANYTAWFKSKEVSDGAKSCIPENRTCIVLQDKECAPVTAVQTHAKAQSIVFSDAGDEVWEAEPTLHPASNDTSDHKSAARVNPRIHTIFNSNPSTKSLHKETSEPPSKTRLSETEKLLIVEDSDLEQVQYVGDINSSGTELKENTVKQNHKLERPAQKTLAGIKACVNTRYLERMQTSSLEVFGKEEPVLEYTCHDEKSQPEAKSELKQATRKLRQASPKPIQTSQPARRGLLKVSDTKLQRSNHPARPPSPMLGAPKYPHVKQPLQSRTDELSSSCIPPTQLSRAQRSWATSDRRPLAQPGAQPIRTRPILLGQSRSGPRHTVTAEENPSQPCTSFPKRKRSLKDKMTGSPQNNH